MTFPWFILIGVYRDVPLQSLPFPAIHCRPFSCSTPCMIHLHAHHPNAVVYLPISSHHLASKDSDTADISQHLRPLYPDCWASHATTIKPRITSPLQRNLLRTHLPSQRSPPPRESIARPRPFSTVFQFHQSRSRDHEDGTVPKPSRCISVNVA